jgi:uncharacterized protein
VTLEAFFAAQARFHAAAATPREAARALREAGFAASEERLALYAELVFGHLEATLAQVYPACRAALAPAAWRDLVARFYARRPATRFDLNHASQGWPAFVGAEPALPPWLPALARFEWTSYAIYASETELPATVDRLTLNSTAELVEHGWALCPYVSAPPTRAAPAATPEVAVLWRDPVTLHTRFLAASPRTLLAIKLAVEGISTEAAAAAGGVPVARIEEAVREHVRLGLLLAPA